MRYSEKPTHEREKIIYSRSAAFLTEACKDHSEITFTTPFRPDIIHHVIPYELVPGSDEMFNYLICQEYNDYHHRTEAKSYRLCRINRPGYHYRSGTLEEGVIQRLEKMKRTAPQYALNEDPEMCIRLTPNGRTSYRMIYTNRPSPEKINVNEDESAELVFRCSEEQLFRYLLRFNPGEARVLYPERLKKRIRDYYQEAIQQYTD